MNLIIINNYILKQKSYNLKFNHQIFLQINLILYQI
jgi:hypothetical protein